MSGEVFAACEFADLVELGVFSDYDGSGVYCRDDGVPVVDNGCQKTVDLDDPDSIRGSVYPYILWYAR